jgi:adenylate cyclase
MQESGKQRRAALDLQAGVFDPVLAPERARRTVSLTDIERRGGLPVGDVRAMLRAFGLAIPSDDEPCFTREEAEVFMALAALEELWPREIYLQVSRVYGKALAQIARTEVVMFRLRLEDRLAAARDPSEVLANLRAGVEELLPLADPLLMGIHRRWVEHELAQLSVFEAERRGGAGAVPGSIEVALLFCDLAGFTAYVDTEGDAAGLRAIDAFDEVVSESHGESGDVVKTLGDGFMLAYPEPRDAVRAGAAILQHMRGIYAPGVHASVHVGPAVFRAGDYFGRTVNLAARLLNIAAGDELVATGPVVAATEADFSWEHRGGLRLRGFERPVEAYKLVSPRYSE